MGVKHNKLSFSHLEEKNWFSVLILCALSIAGILKARQN